MSFYYMLVWNHKKTERGKKQDKILFNHTFYVEKPIRNLFRIILK